MYYHIQKDLSGTVVFKIRPVVQELKSRKRNEVR